MFSLTTRGEMWWLVFLGYLSQTIKGNQEGFWSHNLHLEVITKSMKIVNQRDCWVCTHFPERSNKGFPLIGVPLNFSFMEFMKQIRNDSDQTKYDETTEQEWEVQSVTGDYYQCIRRCNNSNRWWEKTVLYGKQPINCSGAIKVGGYKDSSHIPEIGYKWPSKELNGWRVPKGSGWYWLCGNKA